MTPSQRGVAVGALTALAVTLAALTGAAYWLPFAQIDATLPGRLRLFTLCGLAPALALAIAIARLARHRFFTPEDIDGSGLSAGSDRAKVLQALLQNTLEQSVLAWPVYGWWALAGPAATLAVVPVAASLFLLGRALFFARYHHGAAGRAPGFGLTFYPTVVLLAAAGVALASAF